MIRDEVVRAIVAKAKSVGLEPSSALALVEVETAGATFETDGKTPQLLFERHICWREANKVSQKLLAAFRVAGFAIPHWDRATQYRDQRTSAQRLALIRKAEAIQAEVADRSASWGLGQTMGFLAEELGFANAREMVAHMVGSIDGQIDCMFRELNHSHLIEPLNKKDFRHVARIYNGPGYEANNYHIRLADADKRWARKLETIGDREPPPEQALSSVQVKQIQQELRDLGYAEVGSPDGEWGTKTVGAVSAFQAHEGLPVTGHYDPATRDALNAALPRPVSKERESTTAPDLKQAGSTTIKNADRASWWGKLTGWIGIGGAASTAVPDDLTNKVQDLTGEISTVREVMNSLADIAHWAFSHWWIFAIVAGIVIIYVARQIRAARLADHVSGTHAGPTGE